MHIINPFYPQEISKIQYYRFFTAAFNQFFSPVLGFPFRSSKPPQPITLLKLISGEYTLKHWEGQTMNR